MTASLPALPANEQQLYAWITAMAVSYLVAAYLIHAIRCWRGKLLRPTSRDFIQKLFDAMTFSGSSMLCIGIVAPEQHVLKLLGDTTLFLIIAALAGVGYSLHQLFD